MAINLRSHQKNKFLEGDSSESPSFIRERFIISLYDRTLVCFLETRGKGITQEGYVFRTKPIFLSEGQKSCYPPRLMKSKDKQIYLYPGVKGKL